MISPVQISSRKPAARDDMVLWVSVALGLLRFCK